MPLRRPTVRPRDKLERERPHGFAKPSKVRCLRSLLCKVVESARKAVHKALVADILPLDKLGRVEVELRLLVLDLVDLFRLDHADAERTDFGGVHRGETGVLEPKVEEGDFERKSARSDRQASVELVFRIVVRVGVEQVTWRLREDGRRVGDGRARRALERVLLLLLLDDRDSGGGVRDRVVLVGGTRVPVKVAGRRLRGARSGDDEAESARELESAEATEKDRGSPKT